MIVEKHLIGQTVIVPYMEGTDSDILGLGLLGFLITSSLMWISNRRSRLPSWRHQMTSDWRVFECFDAKEATW